MASELSNYALAQLASKNPEAFNELYTRHHRRVHSLCLSYTKDYALSEDLTQEVFIQLFKKIHTFNNESAFETWLHRITVNQIISYKRRKSAHEMQLPEDHIVEAVTSPVHNPLKIKIEMSMILHQSINALPKETKRVFNKKVPRKPKDLNIPRSQSGRKKVVIELDKSHLIEGDED